MRFFYCYLITFFGLTALNAQTVHRVEKTSDEQLNSVLEKEQDHTDEQVLNELNLDDYAVGEVVRIVPNKAEPKEEVVEENVVKEEEKVKNAIVESNSSRSTSHYGFKSRNVTIPTSGFADKFWVLLANKKNKRRTKRKVRKYNRNSCLSF